ncbi:MAG: helix-turn-helix domain-containing protein [bacterium]|nr:helix-turn-helix domain-containing protein [bacterium]
MPTFIMEDLTEKSLEDDLNRMVSVSEAAELLGVSKTTIRRFSNSGHLKSYRLGPGKHRRFKKRDVLEVLERE